MLSISLITLLLVPCVSAAPTPVVLWHGMGDTCCNPLSMGAIKRMIEDYIPNIYVVSLEIGDSIAKDEKNGFFMNVNDQVTYVCNKIQNDSKLASGYNAMGFSQGGQFLRAVAQRCPSPQMFNLTTFGGQHQGVYGFPRIGNQDSIWAKLAEKLIDEGAYMSWIQDIVVQAEYWQDPFNLDEYRKKSVFLADINQENTFNQVYKTNLLKLKNLVLVMFANDTMVIPRESEWFGFYNPDQDKTVYKLEDSKLYQNDLLGLKTMNKDGKLHFIEVIGNHLQISKSDFQKF